MKNEKQRTCFWGAEEKGAVQVLTKRTCFWGAEEKGAVQVLTKRTCFWGAEERVAVTSFYILCLSYIVKVKLS